MDSVIQKLQWFSSKEGLSDVLQARINAMGAYLDQIQATFGLEFVDKLLDADGARLSAELDAAYLRGFLDSFHLWLEVLAPNRDQPACRANKPS